MTRRLISIVVPARNEEGCLADLHEAVKAALDSEPYDWELIVVDDGSTDATARVIAELAAADPRVRGLHLARGFGQQAALIAGMEDSRGAAIVTMDADLEQPPAAIVTMLREWERGSDIVHGVRVDHPDTSWWKRATSRSFYRVFSFLTRMPMEPGMLDFRLLDRRVANALVSMPEADFFLRGLATWVGFRQARVRYEAGLRRAGATKFGTRAMLGFALRGITSFSTFPLRLATYIGVTMTFLSIAYGAYVGVMHFVWRSPQPGYASTILLVSFLMGVQFLLIGVLGEYVARIHVEVKRRPRYLVARRTNGAGPADGDEP
ncbi:MAG: glycosyltransferase family 2 protein [Deltaproteobacteria bacterium]|nr:glycosyltransferase family 2 protein [Deltaproteobacteria bacterium]